MAAEEEERILEIPIRNANDEEGEEAIQVPANSLPDDVDQIIDVLKAETADLWRWLMFAVEYYRQNKTEQFERILKEGCTGEVDLYYTEDTKGRIAILNAYAAYKISLGRAEWNTNRPQSERLLTDAVEFLNRADRINNMADTTWVNKGVLNMVRGEENNALRDFSNALEINPDNLIGVLGKAAVLFRKKHIKEARDHYMRAIRTHPGCSPNVRVGLGLCFYELKQYKRAVEAFERAIQLDPLNVDALVALSVIELGDASKMHDASNNQKQEMSRKLVQTAMQRLQTAYKIDPNNSMVLNHLANHFFMKENKDYNRIETLARNAYRQSELDHVQAEACYMLGRNAHDQGNLDGAKKFYENANTHWPGFALSKFGLAKLMMSNKKVDTRAVIKAMEDLTKDKDMKNEPDLLYFLGSLYASSKQHRGKAKQMLASATEAMPDNAMAWVEYAQVLQQLAGKENQKAALRAYSKASKVMKRGGTKILPSELYCNVAVLRFQLGEFPAALASFHKALLLPTEEDAREDVLVKLGANVDNVIERLAEDTITILYDIARVMEQLGSIHDAEKIYKAIIEKFPFYVDAHLRLGSIAESRGQYSDASDWYKEAISRDSKHADAWAMLGNLDLHRGERRPAKSKFERLVKQRQLKHDGYARLSIANVALDSVQGKPDSPEVDKGLREALGIFRAVLTLNPHNVYAANGIGAIVAARGNLPVSRQIFEKVREVSGATNADVWVNMGHVAMQEGNYELASTMYDQCLRRFHNGRNPELLLYLANSKYLQGKLEETKSALLLALHETPDNLKCWFNLALVDESFGTKVLNLRPEERTLEQVYRAVESLKNAHRIFLWLSKMTGSADASDVSKGADGEILPHDPITPPGSPKGTENSDASWLLVAKKHREELERLSGRSGGSEAKDGNGAMEVDGGDAKGMREVFERTGGVVFKKAAKAKEHAVWVGGTIEKAEKHLDKQRRVERQKEMDRRKVLEASRKAEEERQRKIKETEDKEKEEANKIKERAEELELKTRKLAQKYLEEDQIMKQQAEKTRSRKKKSKDDSINIQESDSDDDDGPGYKRAKSNGSDSSSSDSSSGSDSSDDNKESVKTTIKIRALKNLGGDSSDSSDEEKELEGLGSSGKKKSEEGEAGAPPAKRKKVALVASDDSDAE